LKYILLDLNAATIDQDPAKRLTERYEHLLNFLTHPKVKLISSDSVCLKLASDAYTVDADLEKFTRVAGVNYGDTDVRTEKMNECLSIISEKISSNKVSDNSYEYLLPYQNVITQ
jgi:NADH/NAD ratio-sensing transcriptional regulator Rex